MPDLRTAVRFQSRGEFCAAWFYEGVNDACVVMASGTAITKEPGTDRFARRFVEAGYSVLAFDFRRLGASTGNPRQVVRVADQLVDWRAAIGYASTLPGVNPMRIGAWGFSLAGGELFELASEAVGLTAAVLQTPLLDGRVVTLNWLRSTTPIAALGLLGLAVLDEIRGAFGAAPLLVPLSGTKGAIAVLTTPDANEGARALDPASQYPTWKQVLAARSVLGLGAYRPIRKASAVRIPLCLVVCDDDQSVPPTTAIRVARRIRDANLIRVPGHHYAPFLEAHDATFQAELAFLDKYLLGERRPRSATIGNF